MQTSEALRGKCRTTLYVHYRATETMSYLVDGVQAPCCVAAIAAKNMATVRRPSNETQSSLTCTSVTSAKSPPAVERNLGCLTAAEGCQRLAAWEALLHTALGLTRMTQGVIGRPVVLAHSALSPQMMANATNNNIRLAASNRPSANTTKRTKNRTILVTKFATHFSIVLGC